MRIIPLDKKEVQDKTYLKISINKAHMGPVSAEKVAAKRDRNLSAAANKIRLTAGLTVEVRNSNESSEDKPELNPNQSWVLDFGISNDLEMSKVAVYFMEAWDKEYGSEGTDAYNDRRATYVTARSKAYTQLGINPSAENKPILSEEQRAAYNTLVGPSGFDYYEYHLAFKLAGEKKFTRSVTYRSVKPLVVNEMVQKLISISTNLKKRITLEAKPTA